MVNTALPEDPGSMEGRCYIQDSEQVIGVEDARLTSRSGNEHASIEATSKVLSEDGKWKCKQQILQQEGMD